MNEELPGLSLNLGPNLEIFILSIKASPSPDGAGVGLELQRKKDPAAGAGCWLVPGKEKTSARLAKAGFWQG
ncbi:hypothetical protein FSARC_13102 [Fusarium sarcochroum]|uniref:Uncharacterized protein n=1 Tax=Fusarium sarcochroum TaxID=1208366 RepID=A0A8H4WUW2_9HYPO|nr:hypothetical protein FSARC_13102 [Fusarium sarcochroum]